jgi:hypothetical protein
VADSLVIAGKIELLGDEAVSLDPRCPGARFMLAPGFDLSAPQPTTDFVASLILDGERPFGRRASNRTVTLPLVIRAPTRAILAAAREVLAEAIDAQCWTLTWTRDPGPGGTPLPLVLDCFRALPTVPVYNTSYEKQANLQQLTVSFPALPYGRSDVQQQVAFAAPVPAAPPPPPAPVVLDAFTAISSARFQQSGQFIVGPFTACWDPDLFGDFGGRVTPLQYAAVFPAPLNLTGMTGLQLFFGLGSRYYWNLHDRGGTLRCNFYYTLTDTSGNTLAFSRAGLDLPSSANPGAPVFTRVTTAIPQNSSAFNYASVAGYSLTVTSHDSAPCLRWVTAYLDALTAMPASQTVTPVTRGSVYTLFGVGGTADTPVSLQFQQAPVPGTPTVISAAGAGNYTVPGGTAWLSVTAIGGGGAGAGLTAAGFGGGGGGAESATEQVFPCAPAQVIPYVVGAGGTQGAAPVNGQASVFGPGPSGTLAVTGNGGASAAQNSTLAGAGGSGSGNSVEYPGGAGRTASGSVGGGGGSSAGPAAPGGTPVGTSAVTLTGSGTWLCPAGVTMVTVFAVGGGGGGGSGSASTNGSGGGGGESATQAFAVVPGTSYPYSVGAGGSAGSGGGGGGNSGGNGASSTFTVGAQVLTAHGGAGGGAWNFAHAGGLGGTGSTAPAHFPGGTGGPAAPYPGGGASSAGTAAAGNPGNGFSSPGVAPGGGGNGGAGSGTASVAGAAGTVPGGGGGGTYISGFAGGPGAAGTITISYPGGAPTSNGAAAVAGGGAGGAGGATANAAGTAGSAPGGGGGGASSAGTAEAGGGGAAGKIIITPFASPAFKSLIVHRPAPGSPGMLSPLVSVGGGTAVPNGATEYTMPQPQPGINADFGGTYTIILIASTWNNPTAARTIFVTVRQYEYAGGASWPASTVPVTVSPGVASTIGPGNQVNNGILVAGVLTLPVKDVGPDNTGGLYTVAVTDSNTSDRFFDCIFVDSAGQTVILNEPTAGYISYFFDEPGPTTDLGRHLGSQLGRPDAVSVMDACPYISGGPLTIPPDDSLLFAYSPDAAAPAIGVSYYERWRFDRLT